MFNRKIKKYSYLDKEYTKEWRNMLKRKMREVQFKKEVKLDSFIMIKRKTKKDSYLLKIKNERIDDKGLLCYEE